MAVRDHVVEMLDRRLAQTINPVRGRPRKAALDDHPMSIPELGVTGRAIDAVALLSALQQRHVEGWRGRGLLLELDGARRNRGRADQRRVVLLLGLVPHVVAAAERNRADEEETDENEPRTSHGGIASMARGRSCLAASRARLTTVAFGVRTARAHLSRMASRMPAHSSTGSYNASMPATTKYPKNPASMENSTPISKAIGTNDGHENSGRPPISSG